jgi:hypothetical protein
MAELNYRGINYEIDGRIGIFNYDELSSETIANGYYFTEFYL